MIYVGLDLHKKTIQIAAVDYRGTTLLNKKIRNTHASLEMEISRMPKGSKYVIESSSCGRMSITTCETNSAWTWCFRIHTRQNSSQNQRKRPTR